MTNVFTLNKKIDIKQQKKERMPLQYHIYNIKMSFND